MRPFLQQVADHYYAAPDIGKRCFLFPNRRSLLFFRKYLGEAQRRNPSARPFILPQMEPVDAFFRRGALLRQADRVSLLLTLYECYRACLPAGQEADSLDDFVWWGEVILADFNDVDSYLAAPDKLFANLREWKALEQPYEGLSETQQEALARLTGHFRDAGGEALRFGDEQRVKRDFLRIWELLLPLYRRFGEALDLRGEAYDGRAARLLAERVQKEGVAVLQERFPEVESFVFVGLNALSGCEQLVLDALTKAGRAECCWDFSSPLLHDADSRAARLMRENMARYGQAFPLDAEGLGLPACHIVSVPSAVGQASVAARILEETAPRRSDPIECAVVLPDERMLMPLLNTLPPEVDAVNVTMGYPMSDSLFFDLLSTLAQMQLHMRRRKDGEWCFYHKHVAAVFANDVFRCACPPEAEETLRRVREARQYYVPRSAFAGNALLHELFTPVVTDPAAEDPAQIRALCTWLRGCALELAQALKGAAGMALELDFARQYYQGITILLDKELPVRPQTCIRLLERLIGGASVPFQGEPLRGLQVMGPLETRALDFKQLIILSANEAVLPGYAALPSFIPPELRLGFGLPTSRSRDGIQAYYFYRMIGRAEEVWMLCDSRSEGLKSGEESRFIKQLEYLYKDRFGLTITRHSAVAGTDIASVPPIVKTQADVDAIRARPLSATALKQYIACPARFYYAFVRQLGQEDQVQESLDGGLVGTIFHDMMRELYAGRTTLTAGDLQQLKKDEDALRSRIEAHILKELHQFEVSGEDLVTADIILAYVLQTLQRDLDYLKERGEDAFVIELLERKLETTIDGFAFKGTLDRLDRVGGRLRVVDYKTGRVQEDEFLLDDAAKAVSVAEKLFQGGETKRPEIALQLYLYDRLVRDNGLAHGDRPLYNTIYHVTGLFTSPLEDMEVLPAFLGAMEEGLSALLRELGSVESGFPRTEDREKTCTYCEFKNICGR